MNSAGAGLKIYEFAKRYFPMHRSLTGNGVRASLRLIQEELPALVVHEVPSGTKVLDWIVPPEWNVEAAFILDESGRKVVDWQECNLHLVAYSTPVEATLSLAELRPHLFSKPDQPDAIPYLASFYAPTWGFCLSHRQKERLTDQKYRVVIRSELKAGHLTYGDLVLKGKEAKEILFSTYVCHPSMGNNETSGPSVATFLAKALSSEKERRYTYRFLFIPETIGSLTYLSRHMDQLKRNVVAGFNLTCVGDNRCVSFLPSRAGNTLADRVALQVLRRRAPGFKHYSFLDRGSDERQYCSPGVDLPMVSIMRSKYHTYPEYHTSLDDMNFISPEGLGGAFALHWECLEILEGNYKYRTTVQGEPQLGRRGLYPDLSTGLRSDLTQMMMNFLTYCDGQHDLIDISETIGADPARLFPIIETLSRHRLIEINPDC